MEWNVDRKIFSMEWIWNERNFAIWNMEKSFSIPFHSTPCPQMVGVRAKQKVVNGKEKKVTPFVTA